MNRNEILEKVIEQLERDPGSYEQAIIAHHNDTIAECGTACCIKGWTDRIVDPNDPMNVNTGAVLSLSTSEAYVLFASCPHDQWPEPYRTQWDATLRMYHKRIRRRAQAPVAIAYLREIITTGKVRLPGQPQQEAA